MMGLNLVKALQIVAGCIVILLGVNTNNVTITIVGGIGMLLMFGQFLLERKKDTNDQEEKKVLDLKMRLAELKLKHHGMATAKYKNVPAYLAHLKDSFTENEIGELDKYKIIDFSAINAEVEKIDRMEIDGESH
jgi:hypothetical protein